MGRKNLMDYNLYKPYLVRQLLKRISQFFFALKRRGTAMAEKRTLPTKLYTPVY